MNHRINYLPSFIILAIGIIYVLLYMDMPLLDDDLVYSADFTRKFGDMPVFGALRKMRGHWLDINGRFADMSNVVYLNLMPHWLLAVACGVMTALYLWMIDLWSFGRRAGVVTLRVAVIAVVMLTFAWWDSFMLFVMQFNYIWTTACVLAFLYILLRTDWADRRYAKWPLAFLALISGWTHEVCGPAVSFGLLVYLLLNRSVWRRWSGASRLMVIAFFVGAFLTVASPGLYSRIDYLSDKATDDSYLVLFFKNNYYVILFALVTAVVSIVNPKKIKMLAATDWIVFAMAAISSAIVNPVGGIVGRPGWFAQTFAVIAMVRMLMSCRLPRMPKTVASTLTALMLAAVAFNLGAFLCWQTKMERQTNDILNRFKNNPREFIYMDYIRHSDVPWYVLCKTKGVPDENDRGVLGAEMRFHGDNTCQPVILPEKLRGFDFAAVELPYRDADFMLLENAEGYTGLSIEKEIDGRIYVLLPFESKGRKMFYARPLSLAPGERPL